MISSSGFWLGRVVFCRRRDEQPHLSGQRCRIRHDLRRREDAGEKVKIDPPPKYDQKDFRDARGYSLRGKLDVPKERFISYPGLQRDDQASELVAWAGLNQAEHGHEVALAASGELAEDSALRKIRTTAADGKAYLDSSLLGPWLSRAPRLHHVPALVDAIRHLHGCAASWAASRSTRPRSSASRMRSSETGFARASSSAESVMSSSGRAVSFGFMFPHTPRDRREKGLRRLWALMYYMFDRVPLVKMMFSGQYRFFRQLNSVPVRVGP